MTIVTRFAPSPTGYLHIGGARTALFNWLYARHMGGKFLIRIEDTDQARNTPEAIEAIFTGLAWLGLDPDEDIVLQSRNAARHVEVAHALMMSGAAYRDYTTPEEMAQMKADHAASGAKGPFRYQSRWAAFAGVPEQPGKDDYAEGALYHTVRLLAPRDGSTTIHDMVQGDVTVQNSELDDMVLLRSDGTPTYMLAVVVDDHDAGVTHVIRGDDHLNNAFRQIPIYKAMVWSIPQYAHIPLIHGEDGKKLSKRTGAASVDEYREELGILAPAMLNYLARLGWSHGNDELFSMEKAIEWFDIKDVNRNPARLDRKKLMSVNGHWIRETPSEELADLWVGPALHEQGIDWDRKTLVGAMDSLKVRSTDLNSLILGTRFLWDTRPIFIDGTLEASDHHIMDVVLEDYLQTAEWTHDGIMDALNGAAELLGIKLGKVVAPLRLALTGSKISPPITDTMLLLGREQTMGRIRDTI